MKILFVDTTTDGVLIGGGHLILPALMGALKERGHDVHLVTKGPADSKLQYLIEKSGATVHMNPWKKKAPVQDLVPVFNDWINGLQPDVYVISSSAAIGWLVLPWLNPEIATFTIGHNNEETFYLPVRHYHSFISKAIGVSSEICEEYIRGCNMPETKVKWIPYGVPSVSNIRRGTLTGPIKLVYVGRIEETQKRITDLARIAIQLAEAGVNYQLEIIGDGPLRGSIENMLEDQIRKNQVRFTGWLGKEEVLASLQKAEVFVLTSAFEGFSIALTEAMANGCCPVVTDIKAGNQQLIESGENGFLIPVGETEIFVTRIKELAENRDALFALREAAYQKGRKFSIEQMAINYETEFRETINQVKSKPRSTDSNFPLLSTCISKYPLWIRRVKTYITKENSI